MKLFGPDNEVIDIAVNSDFRLPNRRQHKTSIGIKRAITYI